MVVQNDPVNLCRSLRNQFPATVGVFSAFEGRRATEVVRGWESAWSRRDGAQSGTTGRSKRLEAI
mgnify:CR=1 FL=1